MSHWDELWKNRKATKVEINPNTDPIFRILEKTVLEHVSKSTSKPIMDLKIVEFGCGQAARTLLFSKIYGTTSYLVDSSVDALELAAQNQVSIGAEKTEYFAQDVLEYDGPDGDLVWSAGLAEHFFDEDRENIFTSHYNASSKYILIIVPNSWNLPYRITKFIRTKRGTWPFGREESFNPIQLRNAVSDFSYDIESGGLGAWLSYYRWRHLGSEKAMQKMNKPTPIGFINNWLKRKDASFDSFVNKVWGREIYVICRVVPVID